MGEEEVAGIAQGLAESVGVVMALRFDHLDRIVGPPTGGYLVRLWGEDFRLPVSGTGGGDEQLTMSVSVNGVLSSKVQVVAPTLLYFVVPVYVDSVSDLPKNVDIVVNRLDDDGNTTETVIGPDAFTYQLTALVGESRDSAIVRALLVLLKRHSLPNVAWLTDLDHAEVDELGVASVDVASAGLPIVIVEGPDEEWDRLYRNQQARKRTATGPQWVQKAPVEWVKLLFTLVVASDNRNELMALKKVVNRFFLTVKHVWLTFEDEDAESFPLILTDPPKLQLATTGGRNRVHQFSCPFVVRGFRHEDDDRAVVERGWTVTDDPTVTQEQLP